MKLLAAVSRRIAATCPSAGPWCIVSFLSDDPANPPRSTRYAQPGEPDTSSIVLCITMGIDLTPMMEHAVATMAAAKSALHPPGPSIDEVERQQLRRP